MKKILIAKRPEGSQGSVDVTRNKHIYWRIPKGNNMKPFLTSIIILYSITSAQCAEYISVHPGPLCDTVEPLISRGRYVPVSDGVNGHEIFRIENGSKVDVCGAPVKGWFYINFSDDNDHDFTGWVRAEFVR